MTREEVEILLLGWIATAPLKVRTIRRFKTAPRNWSFQPEPDTVPTYRAEVEEIPVRDLQEQVAAGVPRAAWLNHRWGWVWA